MRILFIDQTLPQLLKDAKSPIGGWAVQLRQLLVGLRDAGHDVGVLTWKGANAYVGPQTVCELVETYDKSRGIPKLRFFYYFVPTLVSAARSFRPDVLVQSCAGTPTGLMAFVAGRLGVPFVHRIAADTDADGRCMERLQLHERISFRYGLWKSDLVICQNQWQIDHIGKAYPDKPARIIYNAVEIPPLTEPLRTRAQRSYIAWLGVFREQKNLPLLFEIAKKLPEIEFRVAGMLPDNADAATVVAARGLESLTNVHMAGYLTRDVVPDFLEGAIALLSTSHYEGFSNAFLEALLAGTPIVATEKIDPDSLVARNDLGRIAKIDEELAEAIRNICAIDATRFDALSARCRQYVEMNHAPQIAVENYVSTFESLLAGKDRR